MKGLSAFLLLAACVHTWGLRPCNIPFQISHSNIPGSMTSGAFDRAVREGMGVVEMATALTFSAGKGSSYLLFGACNADSTPTRGVQAGVNVICIWKGDVNRGAGAVRDAVVRKLWVKLDTSEASFLRDYPHCPARKAPCVIPFGISHSGLPSATGSQTFDRAVREGMFVFERATRTQFAPATNEQRRSGDWVEFGACDGGTRTALGMRPGRNVVCLGSNEVSWGEEAIVKAVQRMLWTKLGVTKSEYDRAYPSCEARKVPCVVPFSISHSNLPSYDTGILLVKSDLYMEAQDFDKAVRWGMMDVELESMIRFVPVATGSETWIHIGSCDGESRTLEGVRLGENVLCVGKDAIKKGIFHVRTTVQRLLLSKLEVPGGAAMIAHDSKYRHCGGWTHTGFDGSGRWFDRTAESLDVTYPRRSQEWFRGVLTVTESGWHSFFVASSGSSTVSLSQDHLDGKGTTVVASANARREREWSPHSHPKYLEKGKKYYLRVYHHGTLQHLSLAWSTPGSTAKVDIPLTHVYPYVWKRHNALVPNYDPTDIGPW